MIMYLLYAVTCICLVVLQTTILSTFVIFDNFYDLLIPFVLYLGLFRPLAEGLSLIFILGFIMDSFSGGPFGLYLIVYFWLFVCMRGVILFVQSGSIILRIFIVGAGVLIENAVILGMLAILSSEKGLSATDIRTAVLQVLWAVCTGYFILTAIDYGHTKISAWIEEWYLSRREYKGLED